MDGLQVIGTQANQIGASLKAVNLCMHGLVLLQFPNKTLRVSTIFVAEACPPAAQQRRGHGKVTKTLEFSTPRGLPGASRMVVNTLCFAQKGHSDL